MNKDMYIEALKENVSTLKNQIQQYNKKIVDDREYYESLMKKGKSGSPLGLDKDSKNSELDSVSLNSLRRLSFFVTQKQKEEKNFGNIINEHDNRAKKHESVMKKAHNKKNETIVKWKNILTGISFNPMKTFHEMENELSVDTSTPSSISFPQNNSQRRNIRSRNHQKPLQRGLNRNKYVDLSKKKDSHKRIRRKPKALEFKYPVKMSKKSPYTPVPIINSLEEKLVGEEKEYKYTSYNRKDETYTFGTVKKKIYLESESISNIDGDNYILISNFGAKEYTCNGICYCKDDVDNFENERRGLILNILKITFLVIGVYKVGMFAKDKIVQLCKKYLFNCKDVGAELDSCEPLEMIEEEHYCTGSCDYVDFLTSEKKRMAEEFGCEQLSKDGAVTYLYEKGTSRNPLGPAIEFNEKYGLEEYCQRSSKVIFDDSSMDSILCTAKIENIKCRWAN